jgi:glycosyltransferase involved in cell wall biosynthesis
MRAGPQALVLNYYHPWTYGGSERFNQLAREELRLGRSQAFVYIADAGPEADVRAEAGSRAFARLALYRFTPPSAARPLSAAAVRLTGESDIPLKTLVGTFQPDYVRAHFPSHDFIPLLEDELLRQVPFIYDVMDLWDDFAVQPWGNRDDERYYVRRADAIIAASDLLLAKFTSATRQAFIPMGIDAVFLESLRAPRDLPRDSDRKQVLYAGSLGGIWFDWDLVLALVRALPDHDFTFIGWMGPPPEEHDPEQSERAHACARKLTELPNARLLPPVRHADLAPWLRQADIGLIPFKEMALVTAVNPLKVFEYIGAGMPTVQIGMPGIAEYPGVRSARDRSHFIDLVAASSKERIAPDEAAAMSAFADDHTWVHRVRDFDNLVQDLMKEHDGR